MPSTVSVYAGVDLAADPKRTGLATIRDEGERVVVEDARLGAGDDAISSVVGGARKTGVDVPFGWPRPFVEHVAAHSAGTLGSAPDSGPAWRRSMTARRTDAVVRECFGLVPLSVSADRIAHPALRWSVVEARLRDGGTDCPRDGSGRVCEVYPAAALRSWGLPFRGYKAADAQAVREGIVEKLGGVVDWNGFRGECVRSDDVLDAVIAALVAREAAAGRTLAPEPGDLDLALSEGWIHLPLAGMPH